MESEPIKSVYLGDAVYASFDGYHIWLHLNRHDSEPLIALEPSVLTELKNYEAHIIATLKARQP